MAAAHQSGSRLLALQSEAAAVLRTCTAHALALAPAAAPAAAKVTAQTEQPGPVPYQGGLQMLKQETKAATATRYLQSYVQRLRRQTGLLPRVVARQSGQHVRPASFQALQDPDTSEEEELQAPQETRSDQSLLNKPPHPGGPGSNDGGAKAQSHRVYQPPSASTARYRRKLRADDQLAHEVSEKMRQLLAAGDLDGAAAVWQPEKLKSLKVRSLPSHLQAGSRISFSRAIAARISCRRGGPLPYEGAAVHLAGLA